MALNRWLLLLLLLFFFFFFLFPSGKSACVIKCVLNFLFYLHTIFGFLKLVNIAKVIIDTKLFFNRSQRSKSNTFHCFFLEFIMSACWLFLCWQQQNRIYVYDNFIFIVVITVDFHSVNVCINIYLTCNSHSFLFKWTKNA